MDLARRTCYAILPIRSPRTGLHPSMPSASRVLLTQQGRDRAIENRRVVSPRGPCDKVVWFASRKMGCFYPGRPVNEPITRAVKSHEHRIELQALLMRRGGR